MPPQFKFQGENFTTKDSKRSKYRFLPCPAKQANSILRQTINANMSNFSNSDIGIAGDNPVIMLGITSPQIRFLVDLLLP
jgi:hypothetical protein